jgi:hypothetical protein
MHGNLRKRGGFRRSGGETVPFEVPLRRSRARQRVRMDARRAFPRSATIPVRAHSFIVLTAHGRRSPCEARTVADRSQQTTGRRAAFSVGEVPTVASSHWTIDRLLLPDLSARLDTWRPSLGDREDCVDRFDTGLSLGSALQLETGESFAPETGRPVRCGRELSIDRHAGRFERTLENAKPRKHTGSALAALECPGSNPGAPISRIARNCGRSGAFGRLKVPTGFYAIVASSARWWAAASSTRLRPADFAR